MPKKPKGSFRSYMHTFSPIIGGVLSQPAIRWPGSVGKFALFRTYPYLLPCAIAGSIAFISFLSGYIGLREVSTPFGSVKYFYV
jgi:hypothetical protein